MPWPRADTHTLQLALFHPNVQQVLYPGPRLVHTDGARKGPRSSVYSKAYVFPIPQQKSVRVLQITFLQGVNYAHCIQRIERNRAQFFLLQLSCEYPFSPMSSARQFGST